MYLCSVRCRNAGYVIRTAFRRVLSRLLFGYCCALSLGHFSAFNRPSLSFCLFIMSDKEGEEDPKVISAGTLEDLRSYFDQKFSHLKRELSEDQLKSSSSLVKKLKSPKRT